MKKLLSYLLLLICPLLNLHLSAQGFNTTPLNWSLPEGGCLKWVYNYSYLAPDFTGPTTQFDDGSVYWVSRDMNGDGKLDLVVIAQRVNEYYVAFGAGNSPYWKVYLNTETGYSADSIKWPLPPGGVTDQGISTSYSYVTYSDKVNNNDNGSDEWAMMDINGDAKPDLVIYATKQSGAYVVPGFGSTPYWKVFLNTGTGFSSTPTQWTLPAGGIHYLSNNLSYNDITHTSEPVNNKDEGSEKWVTMDMNGDSKPDLVAYQAMQSGTFKVPGLGTSPHWNVYLNTGTGFSTTATAWTLPAGGVIKSAVNNSYLYISNTDNQNNNDAGSCEWNTLDINGDGKMDLVVYREKTTEYQVPGQGTAPYWKAYLGTSSGFSATATNWMMPPGGFTQNLVNYSYWNINYTDSSFVSDPGSDLWKTVDVNGDSKPDLVVYAERKYATFHAPGAGTKDTYWKAYLNTGTAFSSTATNWTLPAGGSRNTYDTAGFNNTDFMDLYLTYDDSSEWWTIRDVNGDKTVDLIIYRIMQNTVYNVPGYGDEPHWIVYLGKPVGVPTGSDETENTNTTTVYPNPCNNLLIIDATISKNEYSIFDNTGRLVMNGNLTGKTALDVTNLQPGFYILQLGEQNLKVVKL